MKNKTALIRKLEELPRTPFLLLCMAVFCLFLLIGVGLGRVANQLRINFVKRQQREAEETLKQKLLQKIQFPESPFPQAKEK